jgi:hypothetical protein
VFNTVESFLDRANLCGATCLVLDIHLDGMSGIELRRQLTRLMLWDGWYTVRALRPIIPAGHVGSCRRGTRRSQSRQNLPKPLGVSPAGPAKQHPPLVNDCARSNKSRQKRPSDLQAHE